MTKCWTLRAAAVALGLFPVALGVGLIGFIRLEHARTTSLREWNAQSCSVYQETFAGAEDPCRPVPHGETVFPALREARADVAHARAAVAAGDDETAASALARALDRSRAIERRSSFLATAVAARATSDVLDVLDAHPSLADRPVLHAALLRTTLRTARRPLEADRLRAVHDALENRPRTAFVTWGATDARIANDIERENGLMFTMQSAARTGDLALCERTGAKARIGPKVCSTLVRTMDTARRLDRARARTR